jgi:hypothetical protein
MRRCARAVQSLRASIHENDIGGNPGIVRQALDRVNAESIVRMNQVAQAEHKSRHF